MKCLFLFLVALTYHASAQPTVYIIRHAEKLANWPERELGVFQPLSEHGTATASRVATYFADIPLAALYSSPTTRTLHTGFPLSQQRDLPLHVTDALRDTSLIDSLYVALAKQYSADQAILLISHSNIIPYLLIKAGLSKECFDAMGVTQSMESRWLLIEGYDNVYRIDRLGGHRMGCGGMTRGKF